MTHWRSDRYKAIRDKTAGDYGDPKFTYGPRWLSRVGFPGLVASNAIGEASQLLRDVDGNVFRSDPEARRLFYAARDAVYALYSYVARSQWAKFRGEEEGR